MQQTCLVSIINKEYAIAFKVFLLSLLKHNNNLKNDYLVFFDESLTISELKFFKQLYNNLIFLPIKNSYYSKFIFESNRKWSLSPACRLEIFKLNYDKIIYFDVDAVCLKSITEILNLDVSFGGVTHELHDINQIKTQFRFKPLKGFNGGFLIIKRKFLNKDYYNKIENVLNSSLWYGNQGPLNVVFKDDATLLDNKYFLPTTHANLKNLKDAFFIHFLGEKKPWFNGDVYDKYSMQVLKSLDFPTVYKIQEIYDSYLKHINESDINSVS
jgi:lipopolysaccharide biosynthesis glycosyltransferase